MTVHQGPHKTATNDKKGSIKDIVSSIHFEGLWSHYPRTPIIHTDPKNPEVDIFDNHCAINVSDALLGVGVTFKSYRGKKRCYGKCSRTPPYSHILLASELADWLETRPLPNVLGALKSTGSRYVDDFADKKGIIYYKDYWQRGDETFQNRTGDHIDLWDQKTLAGSGHLGSFMRVSLGISLWLSDLADSKEVWLWEIPK